MWGKTEEVFERVMQACTLGLYCYYGLGVEDHYSENKAKVNTLLADILGRMCERGMFTAKPTEYPLHGEFNARKFANEFADRFEEGYATISSYGLSVSKKREIKTAITSRVTFAFGDVPKTKEALKRKYPELFPERKKSGKSRSKSNNKRPKGPVDEVRGKQKAGN